MKMKKRLLGILLSLVMVLGLMPGMSLTAYADGPVAKVGNTEYNDFGQALSAWTNGTTLTLLSDVSCSALYKLNGGARTLDLNGKTLTGNSNGTSIQMLEKSVLTLIDSSDTKTGKITGNGSGPWTGIIWVEEGTTFNMYGGTISGCTGAYGVWLDGRDKFGDCPGAIFNM